MHCLAQGLSYKEITEVQHKRGVTLVEKGVKDITRRLFEDQGAPFRKRTAAAYLGHVAGILPLSRKNCNDSTLQLNCNGIEARDGTII